MSKEVFRRSLERGIKELDLLIERKEEFLENTLGRIKQSPSITVTSFIKNLQREVESLKMAKLHRGNALKWWGDLEKAIEEQRGS